MSPMIWALLITSLTTSTIITMSSNHWLLAWLGLELNTMSIMPILMKPHHPRATEATTKYFLIQATAATLILCASTINAWQTGQWSITNTLSPMATTMMTMAIMLKLGLAPVHLWYPEVLQGVTMTTALIITTWQKIAPLTLLYLTHNNLSTNTLMTIGLASALLGGLTGLNQTQTRKLMAFSSIAHMGWLMVAMTLSPSLTTLTISIYMLMTTTMFTSLVATSSKTIQDLGTTWSASPTLLTTTMLTLMSLGGLPPLTGFMPKLLILKELTTTSLPLYSTLLLLSSLPSLFFYIRMAYMSMLTTPPATTNTEYKWRFKMNIKPGMTTLATTALTMLPITTTLYNIT
uniref:NADH-ubiquinone oxidoreductase chain 2 n=1 Tax=Tenuidactylus dadunensis TaxID=3079921 RepID=A0AA96UW63_9SAUR|nr:NADH dehydrogenase subunit 2 [Tenuidactylus dadunensis]WNX96094.1 NADH dehydrogenase subunit 2 [Tenuidactylus dadunensis]